MVFTISFLLCIIGMLYVTKRTFNTGNVISPQMFVFASLLLFLFIPAVANNYTFTSDERFNLILLFGVIGSILAANRFSYNILSDNDGAFSIREGIFKYIAYIYISLLFADVVEKILLMGSITAVFTHNRIDDYLGGNLDTGSSPFKSFFYEGFKICFYIYIDYLLSNRKIFKGVCLFIIPLIHHTFTANTRYDFVAMVGAIVIYYMNKRMYHVCLVNGVVRRYKKKINFIRVVAVGFFGVYFVLLFMRAANLVRHGLSFEDFDFSYCSLILDTFSTDSRYYEFLFDLYNKVGSENIEYGFSWIFAPFVNLILRTFWAAKPYTSFSVRGTELVYYDYTSGNPVCTFTILGEGYVQLGIIGCLIVPFIFLASRNITFRQLNSIKYSNLIVLVILFSLLTYLRAEVPIFWVLIDYIWIIVIKKYLLVLNNDL